MKSKILLVFGMVFITLHAGAQSPGERLHQLVGTWKAVESTFTNPPQGIVKVVSAANGGAVYSTWTQGNDDTYYEANALWGYSELYKQVRAFEVNTIGVASTHLGNFNDSGVLTLEFRDPNTNKLMEERIMSWTADTWKMQARFIVDGKEINHHVVLKRLNE
jgi:hypothetical protein